MLAILLAAALAAAPAADTVYTADGGRLRGTVVEESARAVTLQMPDGTLRSFEPGQITKIEYADGTVTTPAAPAAQAPAPPPAVAPPAPPAAPAAPPEAAAPLASARLDVIFFANGTRTRGTVVEEGAGGVVVRMADGKTRRYPPGQVVRIEYADGTVSTPAAGAAPRPPPPAWPPSPPARPYAPPPYGPPSYGPPPYGPPGQPYGPGALRGPRAPLIPFYFAIGLGGTGYSGNAESGIRMSDLTTGQVDLNMETGVRLTPRSSTASAVALGLYLDLGFGDAGNGFANCSASGYSCGSIAARFGVLVRHTWNPAGMTAPWLAVGVGGEVVEGYSDVTYGPNYSVTYTGWELPRIMAGIDFRTSRFLGVGLYSALSFGRFNHLEIDDGGVTTRYGLSDETLHTTFTAGLRFTLFP